MALSSIDVSLAWLISKSVHRRADRRLNEIENMLANLAKLSRRLKLPPHPNGEAGWRSATAPAQWLRPRKEAGSRYFCTRAKIASPIPWTNFH